MENNNTLEEKNGILASIDENAVENHERRPAAKSRLSSMFPIVTVVKTSLEMMEYSKVLVTCYLLKSASITAFASSDLGKPTSILSSILLVIHISERYLYYRYHFDTCVLI